MTKEKNTFHPYLIEIFTSLLIKEEYINQCNAFSVINSISQKITDLEGSETENSKKQLLRQKEKFLSIIRCINDGILVVDDAGLITFFNPAAEKISLNENLIGESIFSFIEFSDADFDINDTTDEHLKFTSHTMFLTKKSGVRIPIRTSWSLLRNENNIIVGRILVFNDYSQEFEIQEKLKQARDEALEVTKVKSEFLATMSHEIRTPLNGIVSLVSLLEMSDLNDEQREDISDIKVSADQLQSIISNVLDISKIESGKLIIDNQNFSFTHLLSDISRILKSQLNNRKIQFIHELQGNLPTYISGDYLRIKQILINLISNAIKFSKIGSSIILLIKGALNDSLSYNVSFSVCDTGIGIEESKLTSLFTPFFQADGSITRTYGGSGLGLSICKNLIELMGGRIEVKSKVGVGSAFIFYLTLEESKLDIDSINEVNSLTSKQFEFTKKEGAILVVDDNLINLNTIIRYLQKLGWTTYSASSGEEALKITKTTEIDMILLDLHLPKTSGFEIARFIRTSELPISRIPIIAITADILKGTKEACLEAGFNDYISKPIDFDLLTDSIKNFLIN